MGKKRIIGLLGIPVSLPLGAAASLAYGLLARWIYLRKTYGSGAEFMGHYIGLERFFHGMMFVFLMVIMVIAFRNLWNYCYHHQTDFNPFRNRLVGSPSDAKRRAQNRPVPQKYLTRAAKDLTLGTYRFRHVNMPFLSDPEHQLIIGAPGARKSSILLNALIYNFNFAPERNRLHAVFAIDVKPELSRLSIDENRNDVKIIDPSRTDRSGCDPFYGLSNQTDDDSLYDRCSMISRAIIVNPGSAENEFFYKAAQELFTADLMYSFRSGGGFNDAISLARSMPIMDLIVQILTDPQTEIHPKIREMVRAFQDKDSDAFQDVEMTLHQELSVFSRESVKTCFSEDNLRKATPEDLEAGISVFIAIPDEMLTIFRPVFRLITQLFLRHIIGIEEWRRPWKRPIWFLIDEAGSIGRIPDMTEALARGRSKGVMISLVGQAFSQFEHTYGSQGARTILENCKTTIVLSCHDPATAKSLSAKTGEYRETKISKHRNGFLQQVPTSTNSSVEYRPVMSVADIDNLEAENRVLVFASGGWFLATKATFKDIPDYRELSQVIEEQNRSFYDRGLPHRKTSDEMDREIAERIRKRFADVEIKSDK